MNSDFINEVKKGLESSPKTLPSKYFYDEIGDQLFVEIMNLPEYYLSRSELHIFKNKSDEIIQNLNFIYKPVDISLNALEMLQKNFIKAGSQVKIEPLCGELSSKRRIMKGARAQTLFLTGTQKNVVTHLFLKLL